MSEAVIGIVTAMPFVSQYEHNQSYLMASMARNGKNFTWKTTGKVLQL